MIAPPSSDAAPLSESELDTLLRRALERGSVKDAASEVATATGRPRRELYKRALALSGGADDGAAD